MVGGNGWQHRDVKIDALCHLSIGQDLKHSARELQNFSGFRLQVRLYQF